MSNSLLARSNARVTQGCFSYLPDLTGEQVRSMISYSLKQGHAISIEYTEDPHPRNSFWEMWKPQPFFTSKTADEIYSELLECMSSVDKEYHYVKINSLNSTRGVESLSLSFMVMRPQIEPEYYLIRQDRKSVV